MIGQAEGWFERGEEALVLVGPIGFQGLPLLAGVSPRLPLLGIRFPLLNFDQTDQPESTSISSRQWSPDPNSSPNQRPSPYVVLGPARTHTRNPVDGLHPPEIAGSCGTLERFSYRREVLLPRVRQLRPSASIRAHTAHSRSTSDSEPAFARQFMFRARAAKMWCSDGST